MVLYMRLVILHKGRVRPVGYISPGGFVKTAKGWRKVAGKGKGEGSEKKKVSVAEPSMYAIKKINELKSKLQESLYSLRSKMEKDPDNADMKALFKEKQALLRSTPKTYTSLNRKLRWAHLVRESFKKKTSKKSTVSKKPSVSPVAMFTIKNTARSMTSANSKVVHEALDTGWDPTKTAAKMGNAPSPEGKKRFLLADAVEFLNKAPPSQKRAIPSARPKRRGPSPISTARPSSVRSRVRPS